LTPARSFIDDLLDVLAFRIVTFEEMEQALRQRLDAFGPAPRAELLHVLMLPDFERADRIGEFWGYPESLRRVADRLRGGPDTPGGARRDAAGD
jgi:hypothetical protein